MNRFELVRLAAARRFLEHVVFIDDYLVGVAGEVEPQTRGVEDLEAPPESPDEMRASASYDSESSESRRLEGPPENEARWHQVQVRPVADAFADLGIVCGFFLLPKTNRAGEQSDLVKGRVQKLAGRADVVLVDWSVHGDSGMFATWLFRWMDESADARRQLAVVYTGERSPEVIAERLYNAGAHLIEESTALRFCMAKGTVVSVIQKPDVPHEDAFYPGSVCAVSDLPGRVVEELAAHSGGLLASVVMEGLARLRAHTHFMLRQFGQQSDPAFVVHRAATVPPIDAEEQLVELFTDVVRDMLGDESWRQATARDVIESWLSLAAGEELAVISRLHDSAFTDGDSKLLLLDGAAAFAAGKSAALSNSKRKAVERHFDSYYAPTVEALAAAHPGALRDSWHSDLLRFASLSYCALRVGDAPPRLQLGTVVMVESEYWVCIQPVCDAARVPAAGRSFPFLRLTEVAVDGSGAFQLLVMDGEQPVALKVEEKLYNMAVWPQQPANGSDGPILATAEMNAWHWPLDSGKRMRFVCSLRTAVAQRIANRLASTTGRVGLMENEFVRRRG